MVTYHFDINISFAYKMDEFSHYNSTLSICVNTKKNLHFTQNVAYNDRELLK